MTIIKDSLKALIGSHEYLSCLHSTIGARGEKEGSLPSSHEGD